MTSTLQQTFLTNITKLMDTIYNKTGYKVNIDHSVRLPVDRKTDTISELRRAKLALNLNLFKDGVYLTKDEDYAELGQLWKSLDHRNIWGGDSGFGCIFGMLDLVE